MKDETTKPLLKADNLRLDITIDKGRLRLSARQLEGSFLQLRDKEKLEIVVRDGYAVVMRKIDFEAHIDAAKTAEPEDST